MLSSKKLFSTEWKKGITMNFLLKTQELKNCEKQVLCRRTSEKIIVEKKMKKTTKDKSRLANRQSR
jgi:hypothetical protein